MNVNNNHIYIYISFDFPPSVRQSRLGADVPGSSSSHDVLHVHVPSGPSDPPELGVARGAAAPQSAALQEEAAAPHHLHRRAARSARGPFSGDEIPGCWHEGAAGPKSTPARGEGGGEGNEQMFLAGTISRFFFSDTDTEHRKP